LAFAALTPRERHVFDGVIAGKLNKQIADELSPASERSRPNAPADAQARVSSAVGIGPSHNG